MIKNLHRTFSGQSLKKLDQAAKVSLKRTQKYLDLTQLVPNTPLTPAKDTFQLSSARKNSMKEKSLDSMEEFVHKKVIDVKA